MAKVVLSHTVLGLSLWPAVHGKSAVERAAWQGTAKESHPGKQGFWPRSSLPVAAALILDCSLMRDSCAITRFIATLSFGVNLLLSKDN